MDELREWNTPVKECVPMNSNQYQWLISVLILGFCSVTGLLVDVRRLLRDIRKSLEK